MMTFRSRASEEFWDLYNRIPRNAQRAADKQFELFRKDPTHPSLHLKPVSAGCGAPASTTRTERSPCAKAMSSTGSG
jgi:hypothetical protein